MGDTESVDLEHVGLLDADTIPNANQSYDCFSCGEKMSGVFCYACGNKNDNYRRSIWSLGVELFSSLTAFEGRIWRSLRSLILKPGQMAREFSDGARQKWTSPIRMYLATSLLLFGYVALSGTQLIAFGTKIDENSIIQAGNENSNFSPQVFFLERKSTIRKSVTDDAITAFEKDIVNIITDEDNRSKEGLEDNLEKMREALETLDLQIGEADNHPAKADMMKGREPLLNRIKSLEAQIENYELNSGTSDNIQTSENDSEIADKKAENNNDDAQNETNIDFTDGNGNSFSLDSEGFRKAISTALRHPERINTYIGKYLPRIMFVMMPFSMLMGALFIRSREKAMLYDHLVHAAYIHAFSFLLLFVFILLVQLTPIPGLLGIYTLILLIYLPLSAKRMFGRGWFKSFLTSYGVGFIYTFIMMLILAYLIGLGISDILKDVAVQNPT